MVVGGGASLLSKHFWLGNNQISMRKIWQEKVSNTYWGGTLWGCPKNMRPKDALDS